MVNKKEIELSSDLVEIHDVFSSMGFDDYWLFGGVLLGHYRNGSFIDWDYDMDLGLNYPEECKGLSEREQANFLVKFLEPFKKKGFQVEETIPPTFFGHLFVLRKRVTTDLFFHEELNGMLCYGLNNSYYGFPLHLFSNMCKMEVCGKLFNIPTPVEEYFDIRYNKQWKIPIKDEVEVLSVLERDDFVKLWNKKCSWRSIPELRYWRGRDLIKEMEDFYDYHGE